MRILLTNDDGIHAPGLLALAKYLLADGHAVAVAAPLQQHSGSGAPPWAAPSTSSSCRWSP